MDVPGARSAPSLGLGSALGSALEGDPFRAVVVASPPWLGNRREASPLRSPGASRAAWRRGLQDATSPSPPLSPGNARSSLSPSGRPPAAPGGARSPTASAGYPAGALHFAAADAWAPRPDFPGAFASPRGAGISAAMAAAAVSAAVGSPHASPGAVLRSGRSSSPVAFEVAPGAAVRYAAGAPGAYGAVAPVYQPGSPGRPPVAPGKPRASSPQTRQEAMRELLEQRRRLTPAVPACLYLPDASDSIDVALKERLSELNPVAALALLLRRLDTGRYEIDGRIVILHWANPSELTELLVTESCDGRGHPVPLQRYLVQAANVAHSMQGTEQRLGRGGERRITFMEMRDPPGESDRTEAMRIACEQAAVREQLTTATSPPAAVTRPVPQLYAQGGLGRGGGLGPKAPAPAAPGAAVPSHLSCPPALGTTSFVAIGSFPLLRHY
eukprot:TRINITY_DN55278_c0_g1_i1.p1 TRINITY_DN55278_c0_g1~~TRINITY_DN55278_c0_g1_i1.p1  ORF type:complete len:493 (+),score=99.74 TRINITY_DN55278_c0_g1_i1:156-1481(+)